MIKKLKAQIIKLGLNPKKESLILLIGNLSFIVIGVVAFLVFKQPIYAAICVGVAFVFDLLFLTRYSKQIDEKNSQNLQEIATLFGYFRILIHNGFSVYASLKELLVFANPDLKILLQKLIQEIDEDKSVQPFVNFAHEFNEIIIEEMMISIYQLIDDGETSDYLMQFELIFDKFSELLYQKYLRGKDSRLGTIGSAPLIGSCYLIIVLTVGIISVIGELINGL